MVGLYLDDEAADAVDEKFCRPSSSGATIAGFAVEEFGGCEA